MQEIIYRIDNWTLLKFIGGSAVVFTTIIGFLSKYLLTRLTHSSQHIYNSEIEKIRGDILNNNALLTSLIQNHLSSSQKILDKKIQAYELLWSSLLKTKKTFPSGISLVYQILTDDEISKESTFDDLNNNPKLGPVLRSYDMDSELIKIIEDGQIILEYKPYISDNSYKLFYTFHGLLGRITQRFILEFKRGKIYNWKQDSALKDLLKVTLTEKEIDYVMGIQTTAFTSLTELVEYKILQDYRNSLNIKDSTNDTIEYLKDIETLLKEK